MGGNRMIDAYSLLHFAVGICFYYFRISFINSLAVHILFELLENTKTATYIIDNYIQIWPGRKPSIDFPINSIFDDISFALGWITAYYVNLFFKYKTSTKFYHITSFY